jgi:hypothetical protein
MAASSLITRLLSHRAVFACGCTFYAGVFASWALLTDPVAAAAVKIAAGFGFALYSIGSVLVVDDLYRGGCTPPDNRPRGDGDRPRADRRRTSVAGSSTTASVLAPCS